MFILIFVIYMFTKFVKQSRCRYRFFLIKFHSNRSNKKLQRIAVDLTSK